MSVTGFVPELWSPVLLTTQQKAQVFGGLANRDYEGEIKNAGDTVHITSIGDPTISTYVQGTPLTYEQLQSADRTLVISAADSFSFQVDDLDKAQAAGSLMERAMQQAGYKMKDKVDQLIAGKYTEVATANKVNSGTAVAVTTGDIAYTQLTKLRQKLGEANVPSEGRWVVLPPWYVSLLLDSNKIAANPGATQVSEAALINGYVGKLAGFNIYESNNVVIVTGDDYAVIAGTNNAITFAEQINEVEALRLQAQFADAVRGLHLYGAKVTRPDGLAYLLASIT
jgi:hypothetical protein